MDIIKSLLIRMNLDKFNTDNPRYIDTHRDMSFVSLYRICQYIETKFHSIILPQEEKSNAKLSI